MIPRVSTVARHDQSWADFLLWVIARIPDSSHRRSLENILRDGVAKPRMSGGKLVDQEIADALAQFNTYAICENYATHAMEEWYPDLFGEGMLTVVRESNIRVNRARRFVEREIQGTLDSMRKATGELLNHVHRSRATKPLASKVPSPFVKEGGLLTTGKSKARWKRMALQNAVRFWTLSGHKLNDESLIDKPDSDLERLSMAANVKGSPDMVELEYPYGKTRLPGSFDAWDYLTKTPGFGGVLALENPKTGERRVVIDHDVVRAYTRGSAATRTFRFTIVKMWSRAKLPEETYSIKTFTAPQSDKSFIGRIVAHYRTWKLIHYDGVYTLAARLLIQDQFGLG